jgi:hypothetical protein
MIVCGKCLATGVTVFRLAFPVFHWGGSPIPRYALCEACLLGWITGAPVVPHPASLARVVLAAMKRAHPWWQRLWERIHG